jgi:hypothetical protein
MRKLARICRIVGWVLLGLALIGTTAGLVVTWIALRAPDLSAADHRRILVNGIAEACFNLLCTSPAVVVLLFGRWAQRRADRAAHEPEA